MWIWKTTLNQYASSWTKTKPKQTNKKPKSFLQLVKLVFSLLHKLRCNLGWPEGLCQTRIMGLWGNEHSSSFISSSFINKCLVLVVCHVSCWPLLLNDLVTWVEELLLSHWSYSHRGWLIQSIPLAVTWCDFLVLLLLPLLHLKSWKLGKLIVRSC